MTREEAIDILYGMKVDNLNLDDLYTKDKYDALTVAIEALKQEPCEDAISRQSVEAITWEEPSYTDALNALTEVREKIRALPSVSTEKTDSYKQGWHDAISMALKETHNVYTDDGVFRVVQEETLIGVGMAYEHAESEE